jgi:hypothetical protein
MNFEDLFVLAGLWRGEGLVTYPTMEEVPYSEELTFTPNDQRTYLHYQQKTWRKESGLQSHWEVGFLRPLEGDRIQLFNAQSGGRLEVMEGRFEAEGGGLRLTFTSTHFALDERMAAASRELTITGDELRYRMQMETRATSPAALHLEAALGRVGQSENP